MKAAARAHPATIYARMQNDVSLILRVENPGDSRWVEADVEVPEKISLAPDMGLHKGRMRLGIVGEKEAVEKSVKVYASAFTDAQEYACRLTVYAFDRDAVIQERLDVQFTLRAEEQKPPVL